MCPYVDSLDLVAGFINTCPLEVCGQLETSRFVLVALIGVVQSVGRSQFPLAA